VVGTGHSPAIAYSVSLGQHNLQVGLAAGGAVHCDAGWQDALLDWAAASCCGQQMERGLK